ncbi:hypothetical protein EJ08DRAFT_696737 [Tothia fuscella]|uniref:Uncharacterized protein n=1 Tax=Tothia fuscella TaxID=1048955 RepID=A0A9P4TY50_9PEZI|nr:hypothetical protein EJ08DRAFT_696737 [Tothia fuscella]
MALATDADLMRLADELLVYPVEQALSLLIVLDLRTRNEKLRASWQFCFPGTRGTPQERGATYAILVCRFPIAIPKTHATSFLIQSANSKPGCNFIALFDCDTLAVLDLSSAGREGNEAFLFEEELINDSQQLAQGRTNRTLLLSFLYHALQHQCKEFDKLHKAQGADPRLSVMAQNFV